MALQLALVRHGESEGNRGRSFTGHGPSPLTEKGGRQADAVGAALRAMEPTVVYSSDLVRTRETARRIGLQLGAVEQRELSGLRERDMGAWVGVTFEALQASDAEGWAALTRRDPDHCPPDGESHRACALRVSSSIDQVVRDNPDGRVVVVSHGVAISHMVRHLLGITSFDVIFMVENCSIHRFELREGLVRVIAQNDTRHLLGVGA